MIVINTFWQIFNVKELRIWVRPHGRDLQAVYDSFHAVLEEVCVPHSPGPEVWGISDCNGKGEKRKLQKFCEQKSNHPQYISVESKSLQMEGNGFMLYNVQVY